MAHVMRTALALVALLAFVAGSLPASAQRAGVTSHPVPLQFGSSRYEVRVDGVLVPSFLATMKLHFASFDFDKPVTVEVTVNDQDYNRIGGREDVAPDDYWQGSAIVRPLSKRIAVKTEGRKLTFTIAKPGQFSVERPGTAGFEDEVLFLFANPPERNVPAKNDPKIVYLAPGIHQRHVDLQSGQTLYLAGGAVLFGGINVWNAKNVAIRGRGAVVFYGPQSGNFDTSWRNEKNGHALTTRGVIGLTVEGVTFIGRSRGWTIQMHSTFDATFSNIKVVTSFPENLNGDGMDWMGGGRSRVSDSFFRTADDAFAFLTADSATALRTDHQAGQRLLGGEVETPVTTGEVRDILIERAVIWSTVANVVRAGWINQRLTTRDITLRDIDVIHAGTNEWLGARPALFAAQSTSGKSVSRHSNYRFENIRVETPLAALSVNWPEVTLEGFRFDNVRFNAAAGRGILRGNANGLVFNNVTVGGRPATKRSDLNLTVEGEVKAMHFSPAD